MSAETGRESRPTIPQPLSSWLQANPQAAHNLPDPDERWTVREMESMAERTHAKLRNHAGVEKVGEERCDAGNGFVNVWQVSEAVAAFIDESVVEPSLTPCGHTGVVNLGDEYTCQTETCDERFGRETALEVLKS